MEIKLLEENYSNFEVAKDFLQKGVISRAWKGKKSTRNSDGTYTKTDEDEIVLVISGGYKEQFLKYPLDIFEKLYPNMIPVLQDMIGRKTLVSNTILIEND